MTQREGTPGGSVASLRWLIHLTSVGAAGAFLGAAASPHFGWTMAVGALVGGLGFGGIAILRRWLGPRPG